MVQVKTKIQWCGNIEPTAGHFDLFYSAPPYTLYTVQFQFIGCMTGCFHTTAEVIIRQCNRLQSILVNITAMTACMCMYYIKLHVYNINFLQWWTTDGKLVKRFRLKSTFGKYIYFSPDFKTFITIDNTGLLYVLTVLNL